ncbi:hypothetical protein [Psychroserpens algicola]|uniref:hypothetical protein n=1 Tax=Psychroserpens algicola TaxID=1719034 RepID=UPI0019535D33|nr:hypothetical protein [Psychroserpens algicola]
MKKIFQIIVLTLITACGTTNHSTKSIADEKFELCSKLRNEELITLYKLDEEKLPYIRNIHSLLENYLIQEDYLKEISKKGYTHLLNNVKLNLIKPEFFEKFKNHLGYDPNILFPRGGHSRCYDYLITNLKIIDENSWQYKFRDGYWKSEANGFFISDITELIKGMNEIPDEKFQMIMYRKVFLNLIYAHLN